MVTNWVCTRDGVVWIASAQTYYTWVVIAVEVDATVCVYIQIDDYFHIVWSTVLIYYECNLYITCTVYSIIAAECIIRIYCDDWVYVVVYADVLLVFPVTA